MQKKSILSPMAMGSGAPVVHRLLERFITDYRFIPYNSNWIFIPLMLPLVAKINHASLIHTVADYARFFYRPAIPLVISFQNYVLDSWMRPYSSFLQKLHYAGDLKLWTKLAIDKAVKITAVSDFTANLVKKDMKLTKPIEIIYNGVDTNHFSPNPAKGKNQKEVRVFFSGNLTRRKGIQWIPEIAKHIGKNVCIYYTQGLRTRAALSPRPNLKPIGPVPYAQMPERYRHMDILLMPTVREGLSLSVLEAMASGLPVVASNCSSLPEQIDTGKGGFLCEVGDVRDFANKINILAETAKLRQEMGEHNREKVKNYFTVERMIKKYEDLFNGVLGQ